MILNKILTVFITIKLIESKEYCENEENIKIFLTGEYEKTMSEKENQFKKAYWDLITDLENITKQIHFVAEESNIMEYKTQLWKECFKKINTDNIQDAALKRQLNDLKLLDFSYNYLYSNFKKAKICPYYKQACFIDEKIGYSTVEHIMEKSTDYLELEYIWDKWKEATNFKYEFDLTLITNDLMANWNNFSDLTKIWQNEYENENLMLDMDKMWEKLRPFYEDFHLYVLVKLSEIYPQIDDKDSYLPAHLGEAENWEKFFKLINPFKEIDITEQLYKREYNVIKMFETADDFYKSLGLPSSSSSYDLNSGSVLGKFKHRKMSCIPDTVNFFNGTRIKMCTKRNLESFENIHHQLTFVQYYNHFRKQPVTLRKIPVSIGEAIADALVLSAACPTRLQKLGLLKYNENITVSYLLRKALKILPKISSAYALEKWRWGVLKGDIKKKNWNKKWWIYKSGVQKLKSSLLRSEENLDPLSNIYIASFIPNNNFISTIVQFQIYQSFCKTAGEFRYNTSKPLHECDFYGSDNAGVALKEAMSLGGSVGWNDIFNILTREEKLSVDALLDYFQPLHSFLKQEISEKIRERCTRNLRLELTTVVILSIIIFTIYAIGIKMKELEKK